MGQREGGKWEREDKRCWLDGKRGMGRLLTRFGLVYFIVLTSRQDVPPLIWK